MWSILVSRSIPDVVSCRVMPHCRSSTSPLCTTQGDPSWSAAVSLKHQPTQHTQANLNYYTLIKTTYGYSSNSYRLQLVRTKQFFCTKKNRNPIIKGTQIEMIKIFHLHYTFFFSDKSTLQKPFALEQILLICNLPRVLYMVAPLPNLSKWSIHSFCLASSFFRCTLAALAWFSISPSLFTPSPSSFDVLVSAIVVDVVLSVRVSSDMTVDWWKRVIRAGCSSNGSNKNEESRFNKLSERTVSCWKCIKTNLITYFDFLN